MRFCFDYVVVNLHTKFRPKFVADWHYWSQTNCKRL